MEHVTTRPDDAPAEPWTDPLLARFAKVLLILGVIGTVLLILALIAKLMVVS